MPPLRPVSTYYGLADEIQIQIDLESDKRIKLKLHAILWLMEGLAQKDVAETIGVSTATIRNWTRQWNRIGLRGLEPQHIGTSKIEADLSRTFKSMGWKTISLSRNYAMMVSERGGPLDWIQADSTDTKVMKVFRKPKMPNISFPDGPMTKEDLDKMIDQALG